MPVVAMFVFRVEDEYDANYLSQSFQMFQHFNQSVRSIVYLNIGCRIWGHLRLVVACQ